MTTKPRIYDLTRVFTQDVADEKLRKQKQSELTKQIILICGNLGYPVKSASSSVDEGIISKIVVALQDQGLDLSVENVTSDLKEQAGEKKIKGTKTKEPQTPLEPPPPVKKQIKIVRRIKPVAQAVEEKPQETIQPLQSTSPPPIITTPQKPELKTETKQEVRPTIQKPIKITSSLSSPTTAIPLQPFRVAKPTLTPSMMGRTKRPSTGRTGVAQRVKERKEAEQEVSVAKPTSVVLTSALTVKELAEKLLLSDAEVVKFLFSKGIIRTVNQIVEFETAVDCAKSLGYEVITEANEEPEGSLQPDISLEQEEDLKPRPPVVTIMGHVDHGKTSLLDAIRETKFKITEQEAGGITQHIGAYQVEVTDYDGNKRKITFLDTPGHEAFTAMRARGAQVTDIAILVVAADDGVMPQTIEAINHAKAAGVPIVIALNKIDKPEARPDVILGQLADHELLIEDYGGKTVCSKISAKKRMNLDDLLTKITLVADAELANKLRANPKSLATGAVIEAQLSKERGPIAHLLIQNGTLRKGDCLVAGAVAGRVRAMFDDHGKEVEEAPPSFPVEIIGLPDVPKAGDTFQVYKTYQEAKEVASKRQEKEKEKRRAFSLIDFASKVRESHVGKEEGRAQELNIIIKADVHGSAEAVAKEVVQLSTKEVMVRPIHVGSGNITESDVNLAASTKAIIIGFHVNADQNALNAASEEGVDIRIYEIIYKITEDLEKAVLGLLEPEKQEIKLGSAEVRKIFTYGKGNKIAGSYVLDGKIQRNQIARVLRNGKLIFEGKVDGLKRFKDDAKEVQAGFECGISFDSFNEVQESDIIECYTIIEKERTSLS